MWREKLQYCSLSGQFDIACLSFGWEIIKQHKWNTNETTIVSSYVHVHVFHQTMSICTEKSRTADTEQMLMDSFNTDSM